MLAWFPKAFTQGCTIECKSLAENGDMIKKYRRRPTSWPASIRSRRTGQQGRSPRPEGRLPAPERPDEGDRRRRTACSTPRGFANRWTFYIGKDGKISAIDKTVKPATSAEDMAAKLKELKVSPSASR